MTTEELTKKFLNWWTKRRGSYGVGVLTREALARHAYFAGYKDGHKDEYEKTQSLLKAVDKLPYMRSW